MKIFVYITISGLMYMASMKTYKLKFLYILNEKAYFRKLTLFYQDKLKINLQDFTLFYLDFTDTYLLFSKMQVKSLKSQAKIDFFSKLNTEFLGSKTVENIRILSFIV